MFILDGSELEICVSVTGGLDESVWVDILPERQPIFNKKVSTRVGIKGRVHVTMRSRSQ
jgi:hypothetical protein